MNLNIFRTTCRSFAFWCEHPIVIRVFEVELCARISRSESLHYLWLNCNFWKEKEFIRMCWGEESKKTEKRKKKRKQKCLPTYSKASCDITPFSLPGKSNSKIESTKNRSWRNNISSHLFDPPLLFYPTYQFKELWIFLEHAINRFEHTVEIGLVNPSFRFRIEKFEVDF